MCIRSEIDDAYPLVVNRSILVVVSEHGVLIVDSGVRYGAGQDAQVRAWYFVLLLACRHFRPGLVFQTLFSWRFCGGLDRFLLRSVGRNMPAGCHGAPVRLDDVVAA